MIPGSGSVCGGRHDGRIERDPLDPECRAFYICSLVTLPSGQVSPARMTCPLRTRFNAASKVCDSMRAVPCAAKGNTPKPNVAVGGGSGGESGIAKRNPCGAIRTGSAVPNPSDPKCNSFLICTARAPVIKKCPNGLRFDPGCKCCNHAAKVRCDPTDTGSRTPTPRPTARPALTQRPQRPQIPQRPTARPAPTRRPQRPIQTPDDNNN